MTEQPKQPAIDASGTVRGLLETDLITAPTREVLRSRLMPRDEQGPRYFDQRTFAILRAACDRLIPQLDRSDPVDLAAALDDRLADGKGDGWRYDRMPPDGVAYRCGLHGLDEYARARFDADFAALDGSRQDTVLLAVQLGVVTGEVWETLPARRFFEELLAELCECYYSDPQTQEEIGYVGMADAHGWQAIGLDQLAPHEPRAMHNPNE